MKLESQLNESGFLIQGFSEFSQLQTTLFILFLIIYLIILLGNLSVFAVISLTPHLQTPMYIFLMNLSFIDISYSSTTLPKLLHILYSQNKHISFVGCMTQLYFFATFASTEFMTLTSMGYDRYVAICHPLHYALRMSHRHCMYLISAPWIIAFVNSTGHTVLISKLSFCASRLINHFFCDVTPLLKLSCSDTFYVELLTYILGTLMTFNSFLLTSVSYIFIISTVLNIHSSEGQQKAFSTCTSHITCVVLFYGTIICLYMRPTSNYSPSRDKFFALLYIAMIPLLNPIIYTLKNNEFQYAIKTLSRRVIYFHRIII
ncbi:olfactory receptor 8H1-like [Bombina bombina]|uniref:olfactory receptor 8H1-like n=1 Tax=Bombina bombina TaxID=8345 RepID=UPI00235A6C28|nr:olfactory receptor 8H1-like [Bombina bombina]